MLQAREELAKADERLARIIHTIPEPVFISTNNVFSDLMSCIIEQQIHYRSTKKTFEKMLRKAEIEVLTPQNFFDFEERGMAPVNLSLSKYQTVLAAVDFFNTNTISWTQLSDEEVSRKLCSIKGVGKWTTDMILLYTLERPDIFPVDDFHLQQLMTNVYGLNPNMKLKAQMLKIARKWAQQKSLAVKYLLAWKQYLKQKTNQL